MKGKKVSIRMTEEEYSRMKIELTLEGYMSISKYIRYKIFSIPKTATSSSMNSYKITKDMAQLTGQVKKIGVNYNQVVRKFNSLPPTSKNKEVMNLMVQLQELTKGLIIQVHQLKEKIIANGN
jgi:hypothetical protein